MKTPGLSLLILTSLFFLQRASAAQIPDLPLSSDWYKTSVIIFSRPGISNENTAEMLFMDAKRMYPKKVQAFPFDAEQSDYFNPLSLRTSLALTWPTIAMLDPVLNQHPPDAPYDPENPVGMDSVDVLVNMAVQPRDALIVDDASHKIDVEYEQALPADIDPIAPQGNEGDAMIPPEDPDLLELARTAIAEYEMQMQGSSLIPLGEEAHLLLEELKRLRRRDDYRVLYSATWNQAIPDRSNPVPILIQAGERKNGLFELEGSIAITLGRYLHANVELWLHNLSEMEAYSSTGPVQWMQLSESRRMRSTELHYLDHPKFGVLVKIEPIEVSALLEDLWIKAHSPEEASEIDSAL